MALPNLTFDPIVRQYARPDLNTYANVLSQRTGQYNEAANIADNIGIESDRLKEEVLPFDADQQYADNIITGVRENLNEFAERGDYENLARQTNRLARDYARQVDPLKKRSSQYIAAKQAIEERDDITGPMRQASLSKLQQLNNTGLLDDGSLPPIQNYNPSKFVDIVETLDDRIKGIKEDGHTYIQYQDELGNIAKVDVTGLEEEEVGRIALNIIRANPEILDYGNTMTQLGLQNQYANEVNNAIAAMQEKYGFKKSKTSFDTLRVPETNFTDIYSASSGISSPTSPIASPTGAYDISEDEVDQILGGDYLEGFSPFELTGNPIADAGIQITNFVAEMFTTPASVESLKNIKVKNLEKTYDGLKNGGAEMKLSKKDWIMSQMEDFIPTTTFFAKDDPQYKMWDALIWDSGESGALETVNVTLDRSAAEALGLRSGVPISGATVMEVVQEQYDEDELKDVTPLGLSDEAIAPNAVHIKLPEGSMYASTNVDPRDPQGALKILNHEIKKQVLATGAAKVPIPLETAVLFDPEFVKQYPGFVEGKQQAYIVSYSDGQQKQTKVIVE